MVNLIISGSISSGYGLQTSVPRWPQFLSNQPQIQKFDLITRDGLTYGDAFKVLQENDYQGDILILYFGTRIGWPKISRSLERIWPINFKNEGYLELSAFHSNRKFAQFRRGKRTVYRNLAKFLGILLNQYKPEIPLKRCLSDLDLLFATSTQRFEKVIFLQHHHLSSNRLKYENSKYEKFYYSLLSFARGRSERNLVVLELPSDIYSNRYFLGDCVHLNREGHEKLGLFFLSFLSY
jgi:hypothetical protein